MNPSILSGYDASLASALLVGLFAVLNKRLLVRYMSALTAGSYTYLAAVLLFGDTVTVWVLGFSLETARRTCRTQWIAGLSQNERKFPRMNQCLAHRSIFGIIRRFNIVII